MPTNLSGLQVAGVPTMGMGSLPFTTGSVFFVSSGSGSNGNTGAADSPFATLAYAYSKCTAAKGDQVVLMPNHAEVYTASETFNTAGVTVFGLGVGNNRPTFTLGTATSTRFLVSGNNNSFYNIVFKANFLAIVAAFRVTATNCVIQNCAFWDNSSVLNFLNIVNTTGADNSADGLTFINNEVINLGVTSNNTTILGVGSIDRLVFSNNYLKWAVQNDVAMGIILGTGKSATNLRCEYNLGYRPNTTTSGGSLINIDTASTGVVANNYVQTLTTSSDLLFNATAVFAAFNNYVSGVLGASGFLRPAADS